MVRAPSLPPGPPKVQNFEIFVFQRRTFKIWYHTNFGVLISYQLKNFDLGPPFGPPGPRKFKILKFLFFNVGPSKFDIILILGPWFHINWKKRFWAPNWYPGPWNVKILKFLFYSECPSKFGIILILGPWFHITRQILVWGPCVCPFWSQEVEIVKVSMLGHLYCCCSPK